MHGNMNRRSRIALQFISFCVLTSLINRVNYRPAKVLVAREPYPEICKVILVKKLHPSACNKLAPPIPPTSDPCRWDIRVRSNRKPDVYSLSRQRKDMFSALEVGLLRQLDGCDSPSDCKNQSVPCTFGIEDPSDVLWLRHYNQGSKFVVLFRIGLASLLFFLVSMICEGSIFYPHRPGSFSVSSASILAIIAFASLLYILVVPQHLQLSLYGAGPWQSIGYVFLILMIAGTLPGVAVAWVSFCLFVIYFLGFVVEQLLCFLAGILHYLGALSLYQAENTLFHLRLIYYRDIEEEAELDRRLLEMSQRFLRRVRGNIFLYRVPTALEQDGIQVVENTLPDQLFEDLVPDNIAEVDFEQFDDSSADEVAPEVNSRTPLLQRNSATSPR